MIDETDIMEGFTKITETVRKAVGRGIKDPFDLGVYVHIKMEADWSTGIYRGTAKTIAYRFGNFSLLKKIQRSLFKLRKARLINYQVPGGAHGAYRVLIDGFEVTLGGLKGQCLNAWTHGSKAQPDYVVAGCSRAEDGLSPGAQRAEDGPTQDVRRSLVDVSKCDVDEATATAVASSFPHSGDKPETTQDNDNTNSSGNTPRTPDNDSILSVEQQTIVNEQINQSISLWKEMSGIDGEDDSFRPLLMDSKFARRLWKNGMRLPDLVVWSQLTSTKYGGMLRSNEFRIEAYDIMDTYERYSRDSTPRKMRERIAVDLEMMRRARGTSVPDETTPDCVVSPLTPEEKQDVDGAWNDIEVEDFEVTGKGTNQAGICDHLLDKGSYRQKAGAAEVVDNGETFDAPAFDPPERSQTIYREPVQQQTNEVLRRAQATRKAEARKNSIPVPIPIEENPEVAVDRCVSLWKLKHHPERPCDWDDFDYLLDHFDEDDILLAIRRFPDFGNWSDQINDSRDFRDNFSAILEDTKPSEPTMPDLEEL